jgi:hypothetical protein
VTAAEINAALKRADRAATLRRALLLFGAIWCCSS